MMETGIKADVARIWISITDYNNVDGSVSYLSTTPIASTNRLALTTVHEPKHPSYYPLNTDTIDSIRILLTNSANVGIRYAPDAPPIYLTLHIVQSLT